ncbi:PREDICTED: acyl-CoA synthetase family member 4 [Polistes canadensis]|uniref:acyl-CoA synthetase family member 4 n=1 Tax=Polistes canadensis TaxID=91411 RepID=UPI000718FC4D|nr:PREDICTED: acyl-CoA synthetase family member 4 [Polistes canadensis]
MESINKKQKLNYDVNNKFKSLIDIINWNYLNNTAVEYHDFNKIYAIKYKELNEGRHKIASEVLEYIEHFEFIGISDDVPEYCVPTLILGILTKGFGFVNLPLKNVATYNKFLSTLYIKYIFLLHPVDDEDIICKFELYGEYLYLSKVNEAQERYIENVESGYAYAISTSGSTGEEKICKVLNSCIIPNIVDLKLILCISRFEKIAQLTSLTFDPSIIEIFLSLHSGSTMFMVSKRIKNDADRLLNVIFWSRVTLLQSTPSLLFHRWCPKHLSSTILGEFSPLKTIILGGEPCPKIDKLNEIRHIENNTIFYNIYGITEVSCWASIHKIVRINEKNKTSNLGRILSETIFQVRNKDGNIVLEGTGHLYIGSSSRISVIDDEVFQNMNKPVFRNTGDIVHIDYSGQIFYEGRQDDMIKRYGNKLNLLRLNKIVNKLDFVYNCYSWWDADRQKLHLCIHAIMNGTNKYELKKEVMSHLEKLPDTYKPDKIHFIKDIQLTTNGKICTKFLQKICTQDRIVLNNYQDEIEDIFKSLWDNYLNSKTCGFIKSGGTSIMALQISTEICELVNTQFPNLIGMLLKDSTFEECLTYLKNILSFNLIPSEVNVPINYTSTQTYAIMDKSISNNSNKIDKENICLWQKCNGRTYRHLSFNDQILKSYKKVSNIRVKSTFNLISCVDSSPTVFQYNKKTFVTVGSHLGVICTVELEAENDRDAYKIQFPNTIEASIVVLDNFKGIVGCYDYHIYCFCLKTGEIIWKYKTGDIIKCTALLSESHNVLYIGSHDRNIYCLSTENGTKIWNTKVSESSITASGSLHSPTNSVLFGTLGGTCIALNQSSGNVYWRHEILSPIFVSPVILHNGFVLFSGVTGVLVCFDIQADTKLWTYQVNNVILSKPIIQYDPIKNCDNIFGFSTKSMYYLELNYTIEKQEPIVKYVKNPSLEIYTTPWNEDGHACIACKDGTLCIYELSQGNILSSIKLDGEIFSSPVMANGLIIVGCRDNNLYILEQCEEDIKDFSN